MSQKSVAKTILTLVIAGTIGATTAALVVNIFKAKGYLDGIKPEGTGEQILLWLFIILSVFVAIGIHELGHLLTGLRQGFRFQLYVLGPLGIRRNAQDKVEVYFNTDLNMYGGVAATSPTHDDPENYKKFARIILAGPLTSLLFGLLALLLLPVVTPSLKILFFSSGLMSIGLFLATTLPNRTGMFFTDRKRYQRLMTPGRDQQVEMAMLRMMGIYMQDKSYRNLSTEDLQLLMQDDSAFLKVYGYSLYICQQLETTGTIDEEIEQEYQNLSQKMPKSLKMALDQEIEKVKAGLAS